MKKLFTLLALIMMVTACSPIMVNPDDSTPPSLTVTLAGPRNYNAHYTDTGEALEGAIDPGRVFLAEPRDDRHNLQLIFTGRDNESGISRLDGQVVISFTCHARVLGGNVSREAHATFSDHYFGRTPPGETTPPARLVLVEFNYEDLWQRANCTNWGAITDIENGRITDIRAEYSGSAWNNSVPASPGTDINGKFEMAGAAVDISR